MHPQPQSRNPGARSRIAAARTRVRRGVLRRRRLLAAVLAAVAVVAAVRSLSPPAAPTSTITVATRDLPAGALLASADVRRQPVPPDAVPDGLAAAPVGRILAAPLTRGEPITEPRLVGPRLTSARPGEVALPVRISDPDQVSLLTVGDRIDLLATDPQHATTVVLAGGVVVLAVPPAARDTTAGALSGRLVVLAIPQADVQHVTAASVTAFVTYAWPND